MRLTTVPGFDTAVFPYTTDIPFLDRWGEPLLFGPGSIHVAHTADEFVAIAELSAAADHYVALARALLARVARLTHVAKVQHVTTRCPVAPTDTTSAAPSGPRSRRRA